MKIVIDARLYGLENAGLGRYVMNLVEKLKTSDTNNTYYILLRKKYYDSLIFPNNWKKVLADYHHYSFKEQILLPIMLYWLHPDLVHFPHFNVPILYFGKFVVTIHDLIMHRFKDEATTTLPKYLYVIRRLGYTLGFWTAINRSSNIIVPTNEVKKEVQIYYPKIDDNKIVCTYEGGPDIVSTNIKAEEIKKKYDISKPYFIYYGNAYPHKNLRLLAEGIKTINKANENVELFISTPRNVFADRLIKLIEEIGIKKYVKFPGFVSDEEISALLKGSVGFAYPTLMEGFGLQGLEALSIGTLVLVSDIPVFREVYKDKVIYFDPNDVESLVWAMKKAIAMKENERNIWITQGKEYVKNYSWDKMAKETLAVYEKSSNSI
jgi:glycosyltransferase involved in cell wall biosynthesis